MNTPNTDPDSDVPPYFKQYYPGGFKGWKSRLIIRLSGRILRCLVRFCKRFRLPFKDWLVITGFDLTQEVFNRSVDFPTPNNDAANVLGWVPPYLLAIQDDDAAFRKMHEETRAIFADSSLLGDQLKTDARSSFEDLLPDPVMGDSWRDIDLAWGYTYPGFLNFVRRYYGITVEDQQAVKFVCALLVVSGFFFGGPDNSNKQGKKILAQQAFKDAWDVVEQQVVYWKLNFPSAAGAMKVALQKYPNLPVDTLTSYFLGMILGFIPTNGNGHARILEILLKNGIARVKSRQFLPAKYESNLDGEFLRVLIECLRLNYILPGLFRVARGTDLVLGEGTTQFRRVKDKTTILVSNMAAMHDPDYMKKPKEFHMNRNNLNYLHYGYQMHFCVGWDISNRVMIEYFRALILRNIQLKRAGKNKPVSNWLWRLDARYQAPGQGGH